MARTALRMAPGGVRAPTGQADVVEVDADPAAFAPRATIASAACGVCGREAIADLEQASPNGGQN